MYPTIGTFSSLRIISLIILMLLTGTAWSDEDHCFFLMEQWFFNDYCTVQKSLNNKKDIVLANTLKTDGINWTYRLMDYSQGYQEEIRSIIIAGSLRGGSAMPLYSGKRFNLLEERRKRVRDLHFIEGTTTQEIARIEHYRVPRIKYR
jgi:hypothetical protein